MRPQVTCDKYWCPSPLPDHLHGHVTNKTQLNQWTIDNVRACVYRSVAIFCTISLWLRTISDLKIWFRFFLHRCCLTCLTCRVFQALFIYTLYVQHLLSKKNEFTVNSCNNRPLHCVADFGYRGPRLPVQHPVTLPSVTQWGGAKWHISGCRSGEREHEGSVSTGPGVWGQGAIQLPILWIPTPPPPPPSHYTAFLPSGARVKHYPLNSVIADYWQQRTPTSLNDPLS